MSVDQGSLGAFGDLAVALGILGPDGQPNAGWFTDPVAGGTDAATGHGLQHLLADPGQREALVRFVDETLGPPEQRTSGGQTWVPLFDESDPDITVYAVVDDGAGTGDAVHLGVGFTHTTAGGPPRVTTTVHVPLFRFAERGATLTGDGDTPAWLLLGRDGGVVEVGVDAVLSETAPPPGEPSLGGLAATVRVGTHAPEVGFAVTLRDLQLPGAASPRTFTLDVSDAASPDELLGDVLDLAAGLVRAQAEALGDLDVPELRRFAGLAGMLGLRDVEALPPLPLADLPALGVDALVGWAATVVRDDDARDAWLTQLALLLGAVADPARDAVTLDLDPLTLTLGVRVEAGTGGHPALVPWVEASLGTRAGAAARAYADLFRVDTGTGACVGFPDLRLEGVFGSEAGGPALVTGTDPHVGGARLGLALHPASGTAGVLPVPVFHLTLHDVQLGSPHDVLDLSSPQAALDAAGSVVGAALTEALEGLGAPGELVADLLGLDPPAGVGAVTATALLSDPVAAVRGYWADLLGSATALEETLGSLQEVLTGATTALPGGGTAADPWALPLVEPLSLRLWRTTDPDDPANVALHAELAVVADTPVLGDLTARTAVRLGLVTLEPAAGRVTFADRATASVMLGGVDGSTTRLALGDLALVAGSVGVELVWRRAAGLTGRLAADDLALEIDVPARLPGSSVAVPIPLPEVDAEGRLVLPSPDWDAVERALGALVARIGMPELDALVGLLGWSGPGPRLRLAALLDADPGAAVSAWLADLLLDCERVRAALGPVAALLSEFTLHAPLGTGNARTPFRCPVAGEPRAPGVAVWVDPGCAVPPPRLRVELDPLLGADVPDMESVAAALRSAPVPDVADLLVARDALGEGLDQLATRWSGSDGLVGEPADLPDDVTGVVLEGQSYDELVALGLTGGLVAEVLDPFPAAVIHVGCEALWVTDRPAGTAFDLSESAGAGATLPATGGGVWSVRLPSPAAAAADRPDRGGVGEQAARLVALLAGRTDPVTVVGYGAAGAAVVRASAALAADRPALDLAVTTVGAPYAEVATASLTAGLSGDALRLLALLTRVEARGDEARWSAELLAHECTPVQRSRMLTARSLAAATPDGLPPVATPAAGQQVTAVFGALDRDAVLRGIAAHAADGLSARVDAAVAAADASAATGPVTAVHAGVDLPMLDLTLGELLVGAGVRVEMVEVGRDDDGGLSPGFVRGVVVDLHLGVQGGWLVGGPGAPGGVGDLRWMSARVEVPFDGSPGTSELVLHEVRGLGIDRERWVVRAGDLPGVPARVVGEVTEYVDAAVPEVRLLLAEVAARLGEASSELGALLELFGLVRGDGFDADALDRLLHDPAALLRGRLALDPGAVASALRLLVPGAGVTGSLLAWTVGPATLGVDLGTGELVASLAVASDIGDVADLEVVVTAGPDGAAARLSCGAVDPTLGGVCLTARAATGSGASVAVEWAAPGAAVSSLELWPTPGPEGVASLAAALVPALGLKTLAATALQRVSAEARPLLEQVLAMLGMLPATPDGVRRLVLPLGLVTDPAAWFAALARTESLALGPAGVALLDALAPLIVPDRGSDPGYPLTADVRIDYADAEGRLRLTLSATLEETVGSGAGATPVTTDLNAGVQLGLGAPPQPVVSAAVTVDGPGLRVTVDPDLHVDLLRGAGDPLPLYPAGPGFGDLVDAGAGLLVPRVLDLVADQATSATGLRRDVGQLVADVGDALALRASGAFAEQAVRDFAADPAAVLLARLPALVGAATTALSRALDPAGALVRVTPGAGTTTLAFGALDPTDPVDAVTVLLDTTGPLPRVVVAARWDLPDLGPVTLEGLELSAAGVAVAARLGPFPVVAGPVALRPLVEVRAGTVAPGERVVGVGLAIDDSGDRSVQLRWGLDSRPPLLAAVTQATTPGAADDVDEDLAPVWLLSLAVGLAGGVLVDGLDDLLGARAARMLRGVVLTEAASATDLAVAPGFALDLLEPDLLVARLQRLLWNLATDSEPLSVTIDSTVTLGLAASGAGDDRQLGVMVSLPGERFTLAEGSVKVELDVDASWLHPTVTPGLTVYAVRGVRTPGSPATYAFSFEPGVTVAGLGLRFTNAAGPLLELGPVSLDGIAVRVYAEAVAEGVGGGAQLELTGLAFAPTGGAPTNPVASSILADAAESSPSARPAFSPAVAIQRHPEDDDFRFTVRAGQPPGPWWLVIQRQLGPLYLEQIGFDAAEVDGRVSSVSLLFDGRVEIFGLTAAVEELSLTWLGGDLFDVTRWAVDLKGLAVSADLSGVSLAGGMLKTTDGGVVSYVGMLLGKFGIYGLSVFGGYTDDAGNPSFFVFGAFNGPIGGPPAFFVTGIGGGLGINRRLVIPADPAQFPSYPFIYALDPYASVPEPMQALRDLNVYFGPERGTFWFAAGISFTCFSLVDGIAVLAVSFGNGLEINLMGLARMALPNPAAPLVSIELGLLARFSTREGLFMIRAALTDNSWLLYEDVRLTGGFAFVVWWKGPLAGQFVLTIGGYHPDFRRDGYPDVPRVGLSWQVTPQISIKGGCYFALTSEALMAGVGVEAVADFGWAWARASFGADGLVYFDPFWFDVEVRATISAGVEIDTWLGTVSFSITTGCGVHVWGPDFSGEATVEVGPCSVTVPFGTGAQRPGIKQDWPGFVEKYLEQADDGVARALTAITGRGSLPSATDGERSAPPPDGTLDRPFEVYAEFELTVTTSVPTNTFSVGLPAEVGRSVVRSDGASTTLGLNPMGASLHTSRLRLTLEELDQDTGDWEGQAAGLAKVAGNIAASDPAPDGSRIAAGSFPLGVWGPPDPPGTPRPALPSGDVLTTGNQVTLVASATMPAPGPTVSFYTVSTGPRRRLPLQAGMDPRTTLLNRADEVSLPTPTTTQAALSAARDLLFAAPPRLVSNGPQANGARSRLDKASYVGRTAAPPRFGTLADGLAQANGDNVGRDEMEPPEPVAPAPPRDPRVVGFLASGADVTARRSGTTVADGRLPRRPAPTTSSVLARMGRHLPVQLDVSVPPGGTAGVGRQRTLAPRAVPRTGASGTLQSFPLGVGPAVTAVAGLTGLGGALPKAGRVRGATTTATPLRPGDVVALHAPDHALDTATADSRRPRLVVDGSARVTLFRGDGVVLADRVQSGEATIAPGAAYLVAQAGATVQPAEGMAGWHVRSQVVSLGTGTAVAAGCVLTLDNAGAAPTVSWCPAGDAVRGADTVMTSFTGADDKTPVRTVVVVVESSDPERVEDMGLTLHGAVRSRDRAGAAVEPTLVVSGSQVCAVYPVEPVRPDSPGGPETAPGAASVAVRVATGSTWQLTGVLAGTGSAEQTAASLSRFGVPASTARLLAPGRLSDEAAGADGSGRAGCTLTWRRGRNRR